MSQLKTTPAQHALAAMPAASRRLLRIETPIAILAMAGIVVHLVLRFGVAPASGYSTLPLFVTLVLGGLPLLVQLAKRLFAGQFGSDLLAGASIITAVLLKEYLVATVVVLMLSGGSALEQYATRRAASVLNALAKRMPRIAHRKTASGLMDVSLDAIAIGDRLIVLPHEICPVDGTVVEGHGTMDESYLTGEPFLNSKTPGSHVFSGAINGESGLTLSVGRLPVDSRYAKIMQVMLETEHNRPLMRRIGDRLGAWYTPLALGLAALAWAFSGDPDRFLAVMVIATPCPLLLAIPIAIISAISVSAMRGIIIKNPGVLEQIDRCRTLIFDKTGTLTYGRPALTELIAAPGFNADQILTLAASLEQYSKHPLSSAILKAAQAKTLALETVALISEKPGEGLRGLVSGKAVLITSRTKVTGESSPLPDALPPPASGLECLVFVDGVYAAAMRFHDEPRQESSAFVSHLRPHHSVKRVVLLSGDRESEVRYLAEVVGITEMHFAKSPEEKVAIVKAETLAEKTLYVGDGINDAPAMLAATAGVAFGQGSDITAEAADAVILETSLEKVDELIHIGQRMRRIAFQSAVGGMALSAVGMLAATTGYLTPMAGAVAQEVIDLAAVLNALRMALPTSKLSDF